MSSLFDTRPVDAPVAFAKVALEQGIDVDGLIYGVPSALADLAIGERVTVPLGRGDKKVTGYVIEVNEHSELPAAKLAKVKQIIERDLSGISLTADLVELAKWMASYYCCPLGMVFVTMLPAAVKHGTGRVKRELVGLAERGPAVEKGDEADANTTVAGAGHAALPPTDAAAATPAAPTKLSKLQRSILDAAAKQREAGQAFTEIRELADLAGAKTISPVRQLIEKGVLITQTQAAVRAATPIADAYADAKASGAPGLNLTDDQAAAVDHLTGQIGAGFSVSLLHGVTGSGKTEVYLRAIEALMAAPRIKPYAPAALVLVPEIALTPQTVARFQRRFGEVALLHSGLTPAQRHEQWRRIRRGDVRIVVGARSAVFAPLTGIGMIIVDEEHESSYKQDQLPRYHARDVAVKRGQILSVPVLLGSATPSLESYSNAGGGGRGKFRVPSPEFRVQQSCGSEEDAPPLQQYGTPSSKLGTTSSKLGMASSELGTRNSELGTPNAELGTATAAVFRSRYQLLRLPRRVPGLTLPKVEVVDLSQERRKRYEYTGKAGVHLVSLRLEAAIDSTMHAKQQTLLLLNRRGYANYIACPDHKCGWLLKCDHCDVTMVFHKDATLPAGGYVHCHHCTAKQLLPATCPLCTKKVTVFGLGTQRVEEELERKFPGIRLARMDSDSMRTARDYAQTLDAFRGGLLDVLVGTQMIAKGLDFPSVRLVGVISADTSLHMPDFRAAERTFQLIAQVSGRTGRGSDPGSVIVQTFNPADPAITLASRHDYDTFAADELKLRAEMGLPPATRMARIVVRDKDHLACYEYAKTLAAHLVKFDADLGLNVRIRGPAACPIARIAEFHRMQIELIGKDAGRLQKLLTALRNARLLKSDSHVAVDVDPVALM